MAWTVSAAFRSLLTRPRTRVDRVDITGPDGAVLASTDQDLVVTDWTVRMERGQARTCTVTVAAPDGVATDDPLLLDVRSAFYELRIFDGLAVSAGDVVLYELDTTDEWASGTHNGTEAASGVLRLI